MLLESTVAHPIFVEEAIRLARDLYEIAAVAERLPGEYDDNFHLITTDGCEFVLKVMHPARESAFIDLQSQALKHLAEHAKQLYLPRVVPTRTGDLYTEITAADGTIRLVWMLTFVTGTVLAKVRPHSDGLLENLGRYLGEMDSALQNFHHPAAQRHLKWDLSAAGW